MSSFFKNLFQDDFQNDYQGAGRYKEECPECDGSGIVECDCTGGLGREFADDDCPACDGTGRHTCPECWGKGYIWVRGDE